MWLEKRCKVWRVCERVAGKTKRTKAYTDKMASEQLMSRMELAHARGEEGALDRYKESKAKPLAGHIEDYLTDLRTKGRAAHYVYHVGGRLKNLAGACGWAKWSQITPDTFCVWRETPVERKQSLSDNHRIGAATANQYLEAVRSFCQWMVKRARMPGNPLATVEKMREAEDVRRVRRALTEDEVGDLLAAAGQDALVYRFLLGTGLRRAEVEQLQWGDLHLEATTPYMALRAATTKSKRADTLPLRHDLTQALQDARGDAGDESRVFARIPGMKHHKTILKAAGIEFENERGRADLHALRHTFGTMLSKSGVAPRVAMELMRHTDLKLTMKVYTDPHLFDLNGAVEMLPKLQGPTAEREIGKATGTDDRAAYRIDSADRVARVANRVATTTKERDIVSMSVQGDGQGHGEEKPVSTGVLVGFPGTSERVEKMRHVGLEPTTR